MHVILTIVKYDYACKNCGLSFTVEQSMKAESRAECPTCHEISHERIITGGQGFILSGGGWANDNYGLATKVKKD